MRALVAEAIGSLLLAATVVGSGVMAEQAPWLVAGWIGAAYLFTSSTSFANPAITIARALTDTFAGIRPEDVAAFIVAQLIGALLALAVARGLFESPSSKPA